MVSRGARRIGIRGGERPLRRGGRPAHGRARVSVRCAGAGDECGIRNSECGICGETSVRIVGAGAQPVAGPACRTRAQGRGRPQVAPTGETRVRRRGAHRPKACHREPASQRWCGDPYSLTQGRRMRGVEGAAPYGDAGCRLPRQTPPPSVRTGHTQDPFQGRQGTLRRGRRPRRPVTACDSL